MKIRMLAPLASTRTLVIAAVALLGSAPSAASAQQGTTSQSAPAGSPPGTLGTIEPTCFGDGTRGICPCVNMGAAGHGCANSDHPNGAVLSVLSGTASILAANLRLTMTGHHQSTATAWLLQGNIPFGPTTYGDGLRCVGAWLTWIYIVPSNVTVIDTPASPSIVAKGGITAPGTVRGYFFYYRDQSTNFCTLAQYNSSNALRIVWDN